MDKQTDTNVIPSPLARVKTCLAGKWNAAMCVHPGLDDSCVKLSILGELKTIETFANYWSDANEIYFTYHYLYTFCAADELS